MTDHPDRVLPLQGTSNFRDLGGYAGRDGRPVRWRRLFRSAHLGGLTAADQALLAPLGLARTFDFRGVAEREATPYRLPGVVQHALSIEPSVLQGLHALRDAGQALTGARASALMGELYRDLVNRQSQRFAEMFEHLLQADTPVVMHCTAGKDRTGIAAALVLLALGVARSTVRQDFLLTRQVFRPPPAPATGALPDEVHQVLWQVEAAWLDGALAVVDAEHGGVDNYLHQRLGLGRSGLNALADRYLLAQPALA